MSEDSMLMCLIAFVLGFLVARMLRGDGLNVGAQSPAPNSDFCNYLENIGDLENIGVKAITYCIEEYKDYAYPKVTTAACIDGYKNVVNMLNSRYCNGN